jgi:radical SAM superfamily enzyme YgiQ (UPF0313 family)
MDAGSVALRADAVNILLVYPRCPDTFWNFGHILHFVGKKAAFPPLGLLTIAAMLPETWSLKLIDLNVQDLDDEDITWADAVFVSAMIVQEDSAREVITRAKDSGKTVVVGGPLVTTGSERFPEPDCCVIGEAEEIMQDLIEDLEAGTLRYRYQASDRPDVGLTPIPRWDLINVRDYLVMAVQCSRGCPFDCEFCDITAVYGRVPRVKSPEQLTRELDAILDTGWVSSIFIVDDNFIGNRAKAKRVLRAIIDWRTSRRARNTFITEASINLIDDRELLPLMADAGFKQVFIGIETPSEAGLKECRKVQNTNRDLAEAVRTIHRSGIEVMAGFIVGFDADDKNVFDSQRQFIQQAGVVTAMVGLLTALPGTRLFSRLSIEGRIVGQSTGNNLDAVLNFEPSLDRSLLVEGYRALVKELYRPDVYYQRIRTFLRSYRPSPTTGAVCLSDIRAMLLSLWHLGIVQPGRRQFWRLILGATLRGRQAFTNAVELAIRGHHFRMIARSL